MAEFHIKAPQATASEGLAQGPYVAATVGFEPATFRTKGDESTDEPPQPKNDSEHSAVTMYIVYLKYSILGPVVKRDSEWHIVRPPINELIGW